MDLKENYEKIDREALFTDETAYFRFPVDIEAGDTVTFRFRTKKDNVSNVVLFSRATRKTLKKAYSRDGFDYYETSLQMGNEPFQYFFEISNGAERFYYNKLGVLTQNQPDQIEYAFKIFPGFVTPDWIKGAVMYQIFTDRFRNGNPDSDVQDREYSYIGVPVTRVTDWNALPETYDVRRFYGGDLEGVVEKLDYLAGLGIEAIYFNPLFVSPSNHKYDTQDYDHIDPHLTGFVRDAGEVLPEGSCDNRQSERYLSRVLDEDNLKHANAYFAYLVSEAHKRNIRVIIDGVFNHCGSFNKWMDAQKIYEGHKGYETGAFIAEDSPYHDYFTFEEESEWPDNRAYVGWWGHETLPKLSYENSKELHDYIMGIAKKWVSPPYNADGWRLDVAADLGQTSAYNHRFWRDFRAAVKEENPNAAIIAEHYGNPDHWLRGGEWDSVMNYDAFMDPVSFFLTGMEKHSDEYNGYFHGNGRVFLQTMDAKMSILPVQSLQGAMNELSNHDHSRFLTRTNRKVGRLESMGAAAADEGLSYATFRAGVVMQFTLPGAPTVYYGDETGVTGWTDPDSRRTYPWGREKWDLIAFHKDMIRLHKKYSCLKTGSYRPIDGSDGFVAYGRFDAFSSVLTLINHSDYDRQVTLSVREIEMPENGTVSRIMQTYESGYNVGVWQEKTENGRLTVTLPAFSATVYAR